MTAKKIIIAAAILLGASSAALAQSAWTTGTAESRAAAGYALPSGGLYAYAPDSSGLSSYAAVPHPQGQFIDIPVLSGGGSRGYNELVRPVW
jgi:hypothetical protein